LDIQKTSPKVLQTKTLSKAKQNVGSVLEGASKDHEKMFYGDEDSTSAIKYRAAESFEMEILCPVGVAKRDANLIHMALS
jgi:hypothetical protein